MLFRSHVSLAGPARTRELCWLKARYFARGSPGLGPQTTCLGSLCTTLPSTGIRSISGKLRSVPHMPRSWPAVHRRYRRCRRTTMFAIALASLQGLLFRYNPAADTVVVGCPANGRLRAEFETLIGFFTRSLPITASRPDGSDPPFSTMVSQARDALLAAHTNQEVPFDEIVRLAAPPRDLGHNPLFQVWFDLVTHTQATPMGPSLPGLVVTKFDTQLTRTRFDLEFHLADELPGGLSGRLLFATDLFESSTVEAFAHHYESFLSAVAAEPAMRLSEVPILTADEQHKILDEWGAAR